MSTALATKEELNDDSLFALVTTGDCKQLNPQQKIAYYRARCEAAGLDPRTAPFQFLTLQGREILYALKSATDQLAAKHGIRCEILAQQTESDIRVVTVRATTKDGRQTDEIGAVSVKNKQGEDLCNALMKACTKAKRRAVLAVCGLGMLDETELDTIPGARPVSVEPFVQMPRRKSEAKAEAAPADEVVIVAEEIPPGDPISQAEPEDDIEALLQASIDQQQAKADEPKINQKDVGHLKQLVRENGHDTEAVKRFLARRGFASSKDIPVSAFSAIRARLADPTPLEA